MSGMEVGTHGKGAAVGAGGLKFVGSLYGICSSAVRAPNGIKCEMFHIIPCLFGQVDPT